MMNNLKVTIVDEYLISKIYTIRGVKMMLDNDLAELYEIETKHLILQCSFKIRSV